MLRNGQSSAYPTHATTLEYYPWYVHVEQISRVLPPQYSASHIEENPDRTPPSAGRDHLSVIGQSFTSRAPVRPQATSQGKETVICLRNRALTVQVLLHHANTHRQQNMVWDFVALDPVLGKSIAFLV